MEVYFNAVSQKIKNLVSFVEIELAKEIEKGNTDIDAEVIKYVKNRYYVLTQDPIILVLVVKQLLPFFDKTECKLDRVAVEKQIEDAKKVAFAEMSTRPDFDAKDFQRKMDAKLPQHVEDRIFLYLDMLCDYAVKYRVDEL
jgi:hypothetical protein